MLKRIATSTLIAATLLFAGVASARDAVKCSACAKQQMIYCVKDCQAKPKPGVNCKLVCGPEAMENSAPCKPVCK